MILIDLLSSQNLITSSIMKRPYDDMITSLSTLPEMKTGDDKSFKSLLHGVHHLRVTKVVDISKPADKPIEDIDEPEEEDIIRENQMSKNNARMIQLDLKDANDKDIRAIESERIEMLTTIKPNCTVTIVGPVEIRCGNIMLETKHLSKIDGPFDEGKIPAPTTPKKEPPPVVLEEDWPEDEEDDIQIIPPLDVQSQQPIREQAAPVENRASSEVKPAIQVVQLEDWDEDDEDDCIVLN